jgi:hypothetical protein
MASICKSQLGICYVHLPLASRDTYVESEKQHGIHVCLNLGRRIPADTNAFQLLRLGSLGFLPQLLDTQQIDGPSGLSLLFSVLLLARLVRRSAYLPWSIEWVHCPVPLLLIFTLYYVLFYEKGLGCPLHDSGHGDCVQST